jgi:drug/metabolite transporter (DMT)-like permease
MKPLDIAELLALAAIWGASFLFMRIGAGEFGAVPMAALRIAGGALLLLPMVAARGQGGQLRRHWRTIAVVGLLNSAVPYALFAFAALAINAGLSSILNATAPLWGAMVAWLWLNDRLTPSRVLGLAIGFAGVVGLAWDRASFRPGEHGVSAAAAIGAVLLATLCYGVSANFTKRKLSGVPPLAVAAGSQLAAALMLVLPALWLWPAAMPGVAAWSSMAGLAFICTGLALLMYFRLIERLGASRAITVTYLIPIFGVLWGALFLREDITLSMALGCAVILAGTALASGVVTLPIRRAPA